VTGQLFVGMEFVWKFPAFWVDSFGLSLFAMLGQVMIYYTVKEFGALFFSTIMTTRQVVSILMSCAIYLHPLTSSQWCAVVIVFATLYIKSITNIENYQNTSSSVAPTIKMKNQRTPVPEIEV